MIIKNIREKFEALAERLNVSVLGLVHMIADDTEIELRIVQHWLDKPDMELRKPNPDLLKAFCRDHISDFVFDADAANCTIEDFRRRLGLQLAGDPHGDQLTGPGAADHLVGLYQVIRPHCGTRMTYVLEAMEIERYAGGLRTLFFSHNLPDAGHMYEGHAEASTRYYFSLVSRRHEQLPQERSYRCISFHMGDGQYDICLSGVMLRGMSGASTKKEAVGLPFFAIRLPDAESLRQAQPERLNAANKRADPLYRLNGGGHILVGTVEQTWYPDLFDFCGGVFDNERVADAVKNRHGLVIYTVQQHDLKRNGDLCAERWQGLASAVPEH